jgi:hypothetical protein
VPAVLSAALSMTLLMTLLWAAPSSACAACACGSTAALPVGAELPFAGRWRVALSTQAFSTTTADPLGDVLLQGGSGAVTIVAAVTDAVIVDVSVPLSLRLRRTGGITGGTIDGRSVGLGDAALGVRLVWTDRTFGPRFSASIRLGATLPTSLTLTGRSGTPLSTSLQPGAGALAPQLQLTGVWLPSSTVSLLASLSGTAPLVGLRDELGAAVVEGRLLGLVRATQRVSVRGGLLARGVSDTMLADPADPADHDRSARAVIGPEAGITVDVDTDIAVAATASVPVVAPGGAVTEGGRAELTLLVDW